MNVENMKLITFEFEGKTCAGYVDLTEAVVCVSGENANNAILDLVAGGDAALKAFVGNEMARAPLSDVRILAPIPEPKRDIFCVGKTRRYA